MAPLSLSAPSFLQRMLEKLCPHRFSWPHTGGHGQDYQVCLICGAIYGYDTTTMSRTGLLVTTANDLPPTGTRR